MVGTAFFTREDVAGSLTSSEPSPHPEATQDTDDQQIRQSPPGPRPTFPSIHAVTSTSSQASISVQVSPGRRPHRNSTHRLPPGAPGATRVGWVYGRVPGAHQFRGGFGGPSVDGRPIDKAYPADLGRPGIDDRPDLGDDGRQARCLRMRYGERTHEKITVDGTDIASAAGQPRWSFRSRPTPRRGSRCGPSSLPRHRVSSGYRPRCVPRGHQWDRGRFT